VAAAEAKVNGVITEFLDYVNTRRHLPRAGYHDLPASALLRDAIDRREPLRQSKRSLVRLKLSLRGRAKGLVKRALARFR
jgi:hypothetical protein